MKELPFAPQRNEATASLVCIASALTQRGHAELGQGLRCSPSPNRRNAKNWPISSKFRHEVALQKPTKPHTRAQCGPMFTAQALRSRRRHAPPPRHPTLIRSARHTMPIFATVMSLDSIKILRGSLHHSAFSPLVQLLSASNHAKI